MWNDPIIIIIIMAWPYQSRFPGDKRASRSCQIRLEITDGVTPIPWEGSRCLAGTLLSSTPCRTAPDLPWQRVLLLKLQQKINHPTTPQFYLHTVLCP